MNEEEETPTIKPDMKLLDEFLKESAKRKKEFEKASKLDYSHFDEPCSI